MRPGQMRPRAEEVSGGDPPVAGGGDLRLRIRFRADLHTGLTDIVRIRFRAREVNKWFVVRSRIGTYMHEFVIIIRGAKR